MKKYFINTCLLLAAMSVMTSCSVAMAARKDGVGIDRVQSSRCRAQVLACNPTIISSDYTPCGELVEVYQFHKERGSALRALMHGVLDVSTCGVWEIIGTPIEAHLDQKEFFTLRVFYDQQENVQKIELL